MGLYEDLHREHEKLDNLDVKSPEEIRTMLFAELMRVRIVKNLLGEIFPFNEVISNDELHDMMIVIERWEKHLSEKVERH